MMAAVLWTLVGLILIFTAQVQINVWKKYEKIATNYKDLQRIKDQYETIFYNILKNKSGNSTQFDGTMIEKIRYFVMRLQFIHPIYLPSLSEQFLRKDFNFAKYLGFSYGKTLRNFFNTSWLSLLLLLAIANTQTILSNINGTSTDIQLSPFNINSAIMIGKSFLPTVIIFVMMIAYITYFGSIERQLYPQIRS